MKPAFLILMLAAAVAATIIGGLADATDAQIQRNQADYDLKILQRVIKDPALTLIKTDPDSEHF